MAEIHLTYPDGEQQLHRVVGNPILFGRLSQDNTGYVRIQDRQVSREHARITLKDTGLMVEDLDSANGTFVGTDRVAGTAEARYGEALRLGDTTVRIFRPGQIPDADLAFLEGMSVRVDARALVQDVRSEETGGEGASARLLGLAEDLGRASLEVEDLAGLGKRVARLVLQELGATRVSVLSTRDGRVEELAGLGEDKGAGGRISTTVCTWALDKGEAVLIDDGRLDARFRNAESLVLDHYPSVACAPLLGRDRVLGILYCTLVDGERSFTQEDLRLLAYLANLAGLHAENLELSQRRARQDRMAHDIELAGEMQQAMLPSAPPTSDCFELYGHYEPCGEMSGDYYDFPELGGRQGLLIADVSGKGPAAALLMSGLKAGVMALRCVTDLAELASQLDAVVKEMNTGNKFITAFIGVMNEQESTLTYINAGHCLPILLRANGEIEELSGGDLPFGFFSEYKYTAHQVDLSPGDQLFAYTDGITETMDREKEEFGSEQVMALLKKHKKASKGAFLDHLMDEVRAFRHGTVMDDSTMFLMKWKAAR